MSNIRIAEYWSNTKALPLLIRVLIQGAMVVTPAFLLLLVLPVAEWEIDGQPISYAALWSSGKSVAFAIPLLLLGAGAWCLAARQAISRWLLVVSPVASCLALATFPSPPSEPIASVDLVGSAATAAMFYIGLFHLPWVRKYLKMESR